MYTELRKKCVICQGDNLKTIFSLKRMPVYMGVKRDNEENKFSDMSFTLCNDCNNVQIKEIIDPSLVYMGNHNVSTVGELWKNHYLELIDFIEPYINGKTILEIGDPSFKISNELSKKTKEWVIVELNPDEKLKPPKNTKIIKKYFDNSFNINKEIDLVIHSHLLEHITNPIEHLEHVYNILNEDGKLIFSVPNLEKILKTGQPPNNVLNFEHTYYFDIKVLERILNQTGFYVDKVMEYKNHSIFLSCVKGVKVKNELKTEEVSSIFLYNLEKFKSLVNLINKFISNKENVFLYGSHISSQFLINLGLNTEKINCLLDNSESKEGFNLYGTNLLTKSPVMIKNISEPIVIVNHMSLYSEEIKKQLKEINDNVIFL